jgi:tetratricopeptide (TPR) repeat protein
VASEIRVVLSPAERVSLAQARRVNPAAQEALLRGRYRVAQGKQISENLNTALASFQEAVRLEPDSAEGHAEIGKTYGLMGNYGLMPQAEAFRRSRDAAQRALALDEGNAEAHKAMMFWHLTWQHDWAAAERDITRALELGPNDPEAHSFLGEWLTTMGRFDEAIARQRHAHGLAPLDVRWLGALGNSCYFARRYDEARQAYMSALDIEPNSQRVLRSLADMCLQQQRYDEAWQWQLKANQANPAMSDQVRRSLAEAWRTGGWSAVLRENLARLQSQDISLAEKAGAKARIYLRLGQNEPAFAELEIVYREHGSWLFWLNHPVFDPIREDRRFKDLLRRLNLPEK